MTRRHSPMSVRKLRLLCGGLLMALLCAAWPPAEAGAEAYRQQQPQAEIGASKIKLDGPAAFVRIDGLDRNVDDIILATQSPAAAVLAIFAEPAAWKKFQGRGKKDETGLACHAIISTPAPLAGRNLGGADFARIKKDLAANLAGTVKVERRLEKELASVSDHQVERAIGRVEAFDILEEGDDFITYRLESSLEMKLKDRPQARRSRSISVTTTVLAGGKILNLQLTGNPQEAPAVDLNQLSRRWRESFSKANLRNGSR